MEAIGRGILIAAVVLAVLGLGLIVLGRLGIALRPLPGDVLIRRPGLVIYFPLVTMLVLSIILTLVLNFIAWLRR